MLIVHAVIFYSANGEKREEKTPLLGIVLFVVNILQLVQSFCVSDLPREEDQDLRPAQEGQGIGALVLAPESSAGDLALVLRTRMKERRTESVGRKVFPA